MVGQRGNEAIQAAIFLDDMHSSRLGSKPLPHLAVLAVGAEQVETTAREPSLLRCWTALAYILPLRYGILLRDVKRKMGKTYSHKLTSAGKTHASIRNG